MQAFWLNYDSDLTFLDGAAAVQLDAIGADQIIPFVAENTELNVISLNSVTVPVTVRPVRRGFRTGDAVHSQPDDRRAFRAHASEMFPGVDLSQARYMRIQTPGAPIAATAMIKGFQVPFESAVVNGVNTLSRTEITFPHVVTGSLAGANYTTTVGVTNLSGSSQTVSLTFNPADGNPIVTTRTIAGNGAFRETSQSLFGLNGEFQTGWVSVNGTAPLTVSPRTPTQSRARLRLCLRGCR